MITYYLTSSGLLTSSASKPEPEHIKSLVWIDLFEPSDLDIELIDRDFSLDLPTKEEMREIEISSRLYEENDSAYLTLTYITDALGDNPQTTQITFVLKGNLLITMRYADMRIVRHFAEKATTKGGSTLKSGATILLNILENVIDLSADVLEKNHAEIEATSAGIFDKPGKSGDYKVSLQKVAKIGELNSKIRESLVSMSRLNIFLGRILERDKASKDLQSQLRTMNTDVSALLDHANFISGKITFLLDATLGLVNIEQNAIIKIFSVAAVIFLPPTLVASIYGMNFDHMPELEWVWGYPFGLGLMVVSAILPFWYFKHRGWL